MLREKGGKEVMMGKKERMRDGGYWMVRKRGRSGGEDRDGGDEKEVIGKSRRRRREKGMREKTEGGI